MPIFASIHAFHASLPNFNNMFSFFSSRLFPSWFFPPSKPPNLTLSVDDVCVMDEQINPTLKSQDVSEDVEMKDEDNVCDDQSSK
jgi:hypothetical protein